MKSDLYDITAKSQIDYTLNHKGMVDITAPQWLLETKGLV